jgi:aspartate kinase
MKILVQKFGGTSVATQESREKVYNKILNARKEGYSVVVVISAMGRRGEPYATDTLLDLIRLDCPKVARRELDLLFICGELIAGTVIAANLQQRGANAMYLTGRQAGIITNGNYGDARIIRVNTDKVLPLLARGNIIVVAGSQGATEAGEITTLGRGGSDTTACSLGVALGAERIEIYTDVEGVMTTDPRIVSDAKLFNEITYENCIEMAYQGAKVMHPRAVEIASQNPEIELYVRSLFSDNPGTLICSNRRKIPEGADLPDAGGAVGIAMSEKQAVLRVREFSKGKKTNIIKSLAENNISAVDISLYANEMVLIADEKDINDIEEIIRSYNINVEWVKGQSKISVIGDRLSQSPELLAAFIEAVEGQGIEVSALSVQCKTISIWVDSKSAPNAVKAVHRLI